MKRIQLQLLIFISILCSSCYSQKSNNSIKQVEYFASTRGSSIQIIIRQNEVICNDISNKISNKEWSSIVALVSASNLDNIENLQAPSDKRYRDAALAAEIKITTSEKIYTSSQFDHGNPPKEISKLVSKIQKLSKL